MSTTLNTTDIINRLKEAYNFTTDKQLADFLDVPANTFSNWKVRNKLNWDLIHSKCDGISLDYLTKGIGLPFIDQAKEAETEEKQQREAGALEKALYLSNDDKRQMLLKLLSEQTPSKNSTNDDKISILFVDDDPNNLFSFRATFRTKYKIYTANSGKEALEFLEDFPIDIIITDQKMPNMTGIQFLEEAIKLNPEPIRILMTGFTDLNVIREAINKGKVFYYLDKPWKEEEIDEIILLAYAVYVERKKSRVKTAELEELNKILELHLRQKLLS